MIAANEAPADEEELLRLKMKYKYKYKYKYQLQGGASKKNELLGDSWDIEPVANQLTQTQTIPGMLIYISLSLYILFPFVCLFVIFCFHEFKGVPHLTLEFKPCFQALGQSGGASNSGAATAVEEEAEEEVRVRVRVMVRVRILFLLDI